MACNVGREKLDLYLDGELPERETSELDSHLRGCAACAADALQRVQLKRAVQSAGKRFAPTPEFRRKIQQQVASSARPARRWLWLPELGLVAAAVVFVIVAGLLLSRGLRRNQAFGEIADLHVTALASSQPLDVQGPDLHVVKPWFEGKLPFSFNLPDVQNTPFQLLGARVAYLDQQPGAQLVYQIRRHRISVFVFPDRGRLSRVGTLGSPQKRASFTVETWSDAGLRYVVISDVAGEHVHALSELMKAAAKKS
jgi:anti-sigma factor RsiW